MISNLRNQGGSVLLFDTGDVITGIGRQAEIKMDVYTRAIPRMRYDAMGMGEMEAGFVKTTSRKWIYGKDIPLLSANLIDSETGTPLADAAYTVRKTAEGLSIGVTAVVDERFVQPYFQQQYKIRALPVVDSLKKVVEELRKKSDLVVVLAHTGYETAKRLATEVPGIDIVISGHAIAAPPPTPMEQVGTTYVMQVKSSGTHVGKLVLDIGEDKKIQSATVEQLPVTSDLSDDPEILEMVKNHDKEWEAYIASLRAGQTGMIGGSQQPQTFVTALKCRECHISEYDSWLQTKHAQAFQSLRKDNRTTDPECVACHTTGYKLKGGFTSENATPQLRNVQCEACHGSGTRHSRNPAKGYGLVLESTCVQCHDKPNSPDFEYKTYAERVRHKKTSDTSNGQQN